MFIKFLNFMQNLQIFFNQITYGSYMIQFFLKL